MQRVRYNYAHLTADERAQFVAALYHVKSTGVVSQFATEHANHFEHGIHRESHFLPWHRDFLRRFEDALRVRHPEVTIPYWNWTTHDSPSDSLWDGDFLGQFDQAWGLERVLGVGTLPTTQDVTDALDHTTYSAFWQALERVHDRPHNWVGGLMSDARSPEDPVFYLHHCYIDRLWSSWQFFNPDAPFEASAAGFGLHDPMAGVSTTPADVLDHAAIYTYGERLSIECPVNTAAKFAPEFGRTIDTEQWRRFRDEEVVRSPRLASLLRVVEQRSANFSPVLERDRAMREEVVRALESAGALLADRDARIPDQHVDTAVRVVERLIAEEQNDTARADLRRLRSLLPRLRNRSTTQALQFLERSG